MSGWRELCLQVDGRLTNSATLAGSVFQLSLHLSVITGSERRTTIWRTTD